MTPGHHLPAYQALLQVIRIENYKTACTARPLISNIWTDQSCTRVRCHVTDKLYCVVHNNELPKKPEKQYLCVCHIEAALTWCDMANLGDDYIVCVWGGGWADISTVCTYSTLCMFNTVVYTAGVIYSPTSARSKHSGKIQHNNLMETYAILKPPAANICW